MTERNADNVSQKEEKTAASAINFMLSLRISPYKNIIICCCWALSFVYVRICIYYTVVCYYNDTANVASYITTARYEMGDSILSPWSSSCYFVDRVQGISGGRS